MEEIHKNKGQCDMNDMTCLRPAAAKSALAIANQSINAVSILETAKKQKGENMPSETIRYRSGYKYQLASDYSIKTTIKPDKEVDTKFIKLDLDGKLTISDGYAWDGPSGPVIDNKENMRASLVHDALYQLMRKRFITAKKYKDKADKLFKKICIEDGVSISTAKVYYLGLQIGGKPFTDPKNQKKVHTAP